MEQKLLELTPKRYLCPYCGEWHEWNLSHELGYYDSLESRAELGCEHQRSNCNQRVMLFYFNGDYCHYKTVPTCSKGNLSIDNKICVADIVESFEEPCVTFSVPFTAENNVGKGECIDCNSRTRCLMCKLGDENNSRRMHITFGFEFEQSDYDKFAKASILARKEKELQEHEQSINSKERDLKTLEDAVASKEQVSQRPQVKENKEKLAETTKKRTSIKAQLYEKSPKENIEIVKTWAEKYKPVLDWAIPVAAVYGAYRILKSVKKI